MALAAFEGQQCPNCKNYDCLVPLPNEVRKVRWEKHDDRRFEVAQFRCLACASADAVKRAWSEKHKDDKPESGKASPGDGLMFMARPVIENDN